MNGTERLSHAMAMVVVVIWGATFISTKILLQHGLNPAEILFYRFSLAYLALYLYSPRPRKAKNFQDELLFVAIGATGGSLYFLAENTALRLTLASNVSLLVCTAPIFTALLIRPLRLGRYFVAGTLLALAGVFLVVFNGSYVVKVNPWGDLLSLVAALMWAFYSIILKKLDHRYDTLFITRKVFFWGVVTLLPVFFFMPVTRDRTILFNPTVVGNLLFLALLASLLCYAIWNYAVKNLGAVRTNMYIYLIPLVTLIISHFVLDEPVTVTAMTGALCIVAGVYITELEIRVKQGMA